MFSCTVQIAEHLTALVPRKYIVLVTKLDSVADINVIVGCFFDEQATLLSLLVKLFFGTYSVARS